MLKIEKKIKGYIVQFIVFSIFYLTMFGVGIGIIFADNPLLVLIWIISIFVIILFFAYYSGSRVIYKVEYTDGKLIFYSFLKKYYIDNKIKLKEKKIGYFAIVNDKKLRFPFYTGIPSKHSKYWDKQEIDVIKKIITNLSNH